MKARQCGPAHSAFFNVSVRSQIGAPSSNAVSSAGSFKSASKWRPISSARSGDPWGVSSEAWESDGRVVDRSCLCNAVATSRHRAGWCSTTLSPSSPLDPVADLDGRVLAKVRSGGLKAPGRVRGFRAANDVTRQVDATIPDVRTVGVFARRPVGAVHRHRIMIPVGATPDQLKRGTQTWTLSGRQPADDAHAGPPWQADHWLAVGAEQACFDVIGDPLRVLGLWVRES